MGVVDDLFFVVVPSSCFVNPMWLVVVIGLLQTTSASGKKLRTPVRELLCSGVEKNILGTTVQQGNHSGRLSLCQLMSGFLASSAVCAVPKLS
jgi:hypothetical protein